MKTQAEIRAELTQKIVEALKNGVIPWRKPWRSIPDPVRLPTNAVTKKAYQGFNILNLLLSAQVHGYPAGLWASFNQWKSVGASVKRGEKATSIILFKPVTKVEKGEDGEADKTKTFPILKTWSVFNISQVEGEIAEQYQVTTAPSGTRFEDVDRAEFDRAGPDHDAPGGQRGRRRRLPERPGRDRPGRRGAQGFPSPSRPQEVTFAYFAEGLVHEIEPGI